MNPKGSFIFLALLALFVLGAEPPKGAKGKAPNSKATPEKKKAEPTKTAGTPAKPASTSPKVEAKKLEIGTTQKISLEPNTPAQFLVTVKSAPSPDTQLYITAETPFNDPFEEPQITITSDKDYELVCSEDQNDYVGICLIENSQLTAGRVFTVEIECEVKCSIDLSAYLSQIYTATVGQTVTLKNSEPTPLIQNIKYTLASDSFSQLSVLMTPVNSENQYGEPLQLFANYGDAPGVPTSTSFNSKGESTSLHRLGIYLSKQDISPGQTLVLSAIVPAKTEVEIVAKMYIDNIHDLYIGEPVYDFTVGQTARVYKLNLKDYEDEGNSINGSLQLKFMAYSGKPTVTVGFDESFSEGKVLDPLFGESTSSFVYEISEQARKEKGYTGIVYVEVKSYWSSNFYIEASINRKPFADLEPNMLEVVKIPANGLANLIFQDENIPIDLPQDGMVHYKVNLEVLENTVEFRMRNCRLDDLMDCIVKSQQKLEEPAVAKQFQQINYEKTDQQGSSVTFQFRYKVSEKCTLKNKGEFKPRFVCNFHMVLSTPSSGEDKPTSASIKISKNSITKVLKEGEMEKGTVAKGEDNFYAFELTDTTNIKYLQFFITQLQGSATLYASQTVTYPTPDALTDESDLRFSLFNIIQFEGQEITAGSYYIGVHGEVFTDYSIGVSIVRQENSTDNEEAPEDMAPIDLEKGISLTYTLSKSRTVSKFRFTPEVDKEMSIVKLTEIEGDVQYKVYKESEPSSILYDTRQLRIYEEENEFKTEQNEDYIVEVEGEEGQLEIFSILYTTEKQCDTYPWNFPIYVLMDKNSSQCFKFNIRKIEDFHVSVGLSAFQMMTTNISITVKFGDKAITITTDDYVVKEKEIASYCGSKLSCDFTVVVGNSKTLTNRVSFFLAIQTFKDDNVLFDGIAQQITSNNISTENPKKFFYYFYDATEAPKDMYVFLTAADNSKYQLAAKVVHNRQFIKDPEGKLYPVYADESEGVDSVNSSSSPFTVLKFQSVPMRVEKKEDEALIILISVFGLNQNPSSSYSFSIEAVRSSSVLMLGQTKFGYVQQYSMFQYEINVGEAETTILEVREADDNPCIEAYVMNGTNYEEFTPIKGGQIVFNKERGTRQIQVRTNFKYCNFQISFNSKEVPISPLMSSVSYKLLLTDSAVKYYSYHHAFNDSFSVVQMLYEGHGKLYARKLAQGENIQSVLKANLETFDFKGELNENIKVSKGHKKFCYDCEYVIAVQADPEVNAELIVIPQDFPVPLREGLVVRDRAVAQVINKYEARSGTSLAVEINLLYGQLTVQVKDAKGEVVASQQVRQLETVSEIKVNVPEQTGSFSLDSKATYLIEVKAQVSSSYYIGVRIESPVNRVVEGVPLVRNLTNGNQLNVTFENVRSSGNLTLLIEDLSYYSNEQKPGFDLEVLLNGRKLQNVSKSISESSTNLQIPAKFGNYTLLFAPKLNTAVQVILAKDGINHLTRGTTYLWEKPQVFEIYSPGDSIMIELYACKGEVRVEASSNYTLLSGDGAQAGLVRMEHSNYGGHYVISAEDLHGEYFISAKNENTEANSNIGYLISYQLYSPKNGEVMPYKVYGTSSPDIRYVYNTEGIDFTLNRVSRKDGKALEGNVIYKLYISNNEAAIRQKTICSLGDVFTSVKQVPASQKGPITFSFTAKQIKQIIGESESYLVGAEAVLLLGQNEYKTIKEVNFIYEVAQLLFTNTKIEYQTTTTSENHKIVVLYIVLPFILGSLLLFVAARGLIRVLRRGPSQLIEEEGFEPVVGTSQSVTVTNQDVNKGGAETI